MDIVERNNIELIHHEWNAIFPIICRINHSCLPNAIWFWDPQTQTQNVVSIVDIPAGEEICVMYCHHGYSRELRRKYLLQCFGFYCQCKRCNMIQKKQIEFDDKLNRIYTKFRLKLDQYITNKDVRKLTQMVDMTQHYFPDVAIVFEYILQSIKHNDTMDMHITDSTRFHELCSRCYKKLVSSDYN